MEYFDILDENGKPTGEKKLRSEVHAQGDWHQTVHIYVFRKKGDTFEFLVHLRAKGKDLHPNTWDTRFGGHVKSGETIEDTAVSELKEEAGLEVRLEDLIKGNMTKHDGGTNREFNSVFFYNFTGDMSELKFNDGEVQKAEWMTVDEILKPVRNSPEPWMGKREGFGDTVADLERNLK